MALTCKQKAMLRTLKESVLSCKIEYINSYEEFYSYYLQLLDDYNCFDDVPYPKSERLLRLKLKSISSRCNFEKSLRSYHNFKKIVKEEDETFINISLGKECN